jgi:hypothetical protein
MLSVARRPQAGAMRCVPPMALYTMRPSSHPARPECHVVLRPRCGATRRPTTPVGPSAALAGRDVHARGRRCDGPQWQSQQGPQRVSAAGLSGSGLSGRGLSGSGLSGRGLSGSGLSGRGLSGRGLSGRELRGSTNTPAARACVPWHTARRARRQCAAWRTAQQTNNGPPAAEQRR